MRGPETTLSSVTVEGMGLVPWSLPLCRSGMLQATCSSEGDRALWGGGDMLSFRLVMGKYSFAPTEHAYVPQI